MEDRKCTKKYNKYLNISNTIEEYDNEDDESSVSLSSIRPSNTADNTFMKIHRMEGFRDGSRSHRSDCAQKSNSNSKVKDNMVKSKQNSSPTSQSNLSLIAILLSREQDHLKEIEMLKTKNSNLKEAMRGLLDERKKDLERINMLESKIDGIIMSKRTEEPAVGGKENMKDEEVRNKSRKSSKVNKFSHDEVNNGFRDLKKKNNVIEKRDIDRRDSFANLSPKPNYFTRKYR